MPASPVWFLLFLIIILSGLFTLVSVLAIRHLAGRIRGRNTDRDRQILTAALYGFVKKKTDFHVPGTKLNIFKEILVDEAQRLSWRERRRVSEFLRSKNLMTRLL